MGRILPVFMHLLIHPLLESELLEPSWEYSEMEKKKSSPWAFSPEVLRCVFLVQKME